mmetsp:Transcript_37506/g.82250  ORF Transcript_37506/g.82250 Transcript_37506/m.82250 type:complete len:200 (-) Transcript_37506:430-1029(-)
MPNESLVALGMLQQKRRLVHHGIHIRQPSHVASESAVILLKLSPGRLGVNLGAAHAHELQRTVVGSAAGRTLQQLLDSHAVDVPILNHGCHPFRPGLVVAQLSFLRVVPYYRYRSLLHLEMDQLHQRGITVGLPQRVGNHGQMMSKMRNAGVVNFGKLGTNGSNRLLLLLLLLVPAIHLLPQFSLGVAQVQSHALLGKI